MVSLLGFSGGASVGADGTVARVDRGVRQGEEALRQLVGLALADLVGRDGHQRVVAAFGLHGHADPADRAGEGQPLRLLLHRREPRAEELGRVFGGGATFVTKSSEEKVFTSQELYDLAFQVGRKGIEVQRYKGLGEMNPEQLRETTLDPNARTLSQVVILDDADAGDRIVTLMGDDVPERKEFIEKNALHAEIDL